MAGKLKPLDVERETRPGKYPDGDGLYLVVASATSKNWSYRYWKDGKQRWLGMGSVKEVSLKEARLARDAARLRVKGDRSTPGIDIVQEKRAAREEAKAVEIKVTLPNFEQCAEVYIRERWSTWSKKHRNQWPSSLKRYAYPTIGKLAIPEIKPSHIYELLRPIWVEKRETANRVRGRIETIIAKNVDVDDTDFRNPAELTKQLREKLPRRPKRVVRHHPAPVMARERRYLVAIISCGPQRFSCSAYRRARMSLSERYASNPRGASDNAAVVWIQLLRLTKRETVMSESDFEAQLRADGYTEIEAQKLAPRPGKGRHRHHFAIRGFVVSGTFVVAQESQPVTYSAGQIFAVDEGKLHDEWVGPDGAQVLVGRKFSN